MPLTFWMKSAKKTSLTEDASGKTKRTLRAGALKEKKKSPSCLKTLEAAISDCKWTTEAFASCVRVNVRVNLSIVGSGLEVCPNFTGPNPIILAQHGIVTKSNCWQIVQFLLEGEVWKAFDYHNGFDLEKDWGWESSRVLTRTPAQTCVWRNRNSCSPPPFNLLLHLFVVLCVIIFLKMVFVLRFQVCVSILFGIAQIGSTNRKVDQMEKANFEKPP